MHKGFLILLFKISIITDSRQSGQEIHSDLKFTILKPRNKKIWKEDHKIPQRCEFSYTEENEKWKHVKRRAESLGYRNRHVHLHQYYSLHWLNEDPENPSASPHQEVIQISEVSLHPTEAAKAFLPLLHLDKLASDSVGRREINNKW